MKALTIETPIPSEPLEKLFTIFSQADIFSAPVDIAIEIVRRAADTYPKQDQLFDHFTRYYEHIRKELPEDLPKFASAWNQIFLRMFHNPCRKTDALFIRGLDLDEYSFETEEESNAHLKETELWNLANSGIPLLLQRELVTNCVINLIRIIFREKRPLKNQLPLLWFTHALQKNFDHTLCDAHLEIYAIAEVNLIESLGCFIDHPDFRKMARQRLALFDKKTKDKVKRQVNEEVRDYLAPTLWETLGLQ